MFSQLSLLLMSATAQADEYLDALEKAKTLLQEGKHQECIDTIDEARLLMDIGMAKSKPPKDGEKPLVYTPEQISFLYLYRGNARYLQSEGDGLDDWRKALIIHPYLEWDENLVTDGQAWDIFLAIKGEIRTRNEIDLSIPEKNGRAVIYVDGIQRLQGDMVPEGEHFVQVKCPKDDVQSFYTTFRKSIKWVKACPYKYDVNEEVEVIIENEWDAFGPAFGNTDAPIDINEEVETSDGQEEEEYVSPWQRIDKNLVYASTGLVLVGSVLYTRALSEKNAYMDFDNPDIKTLEDLQDLRKKTNNHFYASMGSFGTAAGVYSYAIWKIRQNYSE
jgi:hypothetical protein